MTSSLSAKIRAAAHRWQQQGFVVVARYPLFFLFFPIIIVERSQCFHALYESPIRSTLVNAPSGLLRSHPRLQRRSCVVHVRKRERERAVGVGDGEINVYIVVRQNSTKGRDWLCGCDDRWRRVVVVAQETSVVSR